MQPSLQFSIDMSTAGDSTSMADAGDVNYREWTIALGTTTAVFLVTTLLLACILFIVVCRKIARLRKERETGGQGVSSSHWIDHANLNSMLSQERDSPENKPQNIWSISTQTFDQNHQVQRTSQSASSAMTTNPADIPSGSSPQSPTSPGGGCGTAQNGVVSSFGVTVENRSRVIDGGGERSASTGPSSPTAVAGSSSGQWNVKPVPPCPPPKTRKKSKGRSDLESDQDPTPYVYPMQKLMQRLKHRERERDPGATAQTGGNQSHEYAQPHGHLHAMQRDQQTSATNNPKKDKYQPIDPKLKQPVGPYQQLLDNGLPRGQSLPAISTFATLS